MKKDKKIVKRVILLIFVIALLAGSIFIYFSWFFTGINKFEIVSKVELTNSYDSKNGYWWGFNQNKLVSIGDTTFTFTYDNSNLKNGNSSETNPAKCEFYIITNDNKSKFGGASCNRPCNVLSDAVHNKIYYIVSEPVGESFTDSYDHTSFAKAVMYTYSFNSNTKEIVIETLKPLFPAQKQMDL